MKNSHDHLLLDIVYELYEKIASLALKEQTKRYKAPDLHETEHNIANMLSKQVDYLVNATITGMPHSYTSGQHDNNHASHSENHQGTLPTHPVSNDLSRYLTEHHADANCHPKLSDQMKEHTTTHIHSAMRYARQGDIKTARLHVDLAQCALKGICCLTPTEDYAEFAREVEQNLLQLQDDFCSPQ